ncbi:MAG: hypothetical protein ABIJ09_07670 [Pseudomonadota bacterium]
MRVLLFPGLVAVWTVLLLGAGCPQAGTPCEDQTACGSSLLCVDGVCRRPCNAGSDCATAEQCRNGSCLPGSPSQLDAGNLDRSPGVEHPASDRAPLDSPALDRPGGEGIVEDSATGTDAGIRDLGTPDGNVPPDSAGQDRSCSGAYHDGGDGRCVPIGQCSAGYVRPFVDGDGDGVGSGEATVECLAQPLPAGLSVFGDDCNDEDAALWQWLQGYPERDSDGFSGALEVVCSGSSLPPSHLYTPRPPPYIAFQATEVVNEGATGPRDWQQLPAVLLRDGSGASCTLSFVTSMSNRLVARSFDLNLPVDARVLGVLVHVVRRRTGAGSIVDSTVQLWVHGVAQGTNHASAANWPADFEEIVYGSNSDTWGMNLDAAQVNAADFGMALVARHTSGFTPATAEVDAAWMEVVADRGADCDDNDAGHWIRRTVFLDLDRDGFGAGVEQAACLGTALEPGTAENADDCYDDSADAYPGQQFYFTTDRGDGSFDYDCDRATLKETTVSHLGCDCGSGSCGPQTENEVLPTADCGLPFTVQRCRDDCALCIQEPLNLTVACR